MRARYPITMFLLALAGPGVTAGSAAAEPVVAEPAGAGTAGAGTAVAGTAADRAPHVAATAADSDRLELGVGPAFRSAHGNSVEALDAGTMAGVSMHAAVPIERLRIPGFDVQVEGTLEITGSEGTTFRTMSSDTSLGLLALGVRLRRPLSPRWTASARADLGVARASVTIQDMASNVDAIADAGWAGAGYLGAGMEAMLIGRRQLYGEMSLGLRVEAGYSAITPVHMDGTPEGRAGDEDAIRIPATSAGLGSLYLGAWTTSFAAVGRF